MSCKLCGHSKPYCYTNYIDGHFDLNDGYLCQSCFEEVGGTMIKLVSNIDNLKKFASDTKRLLSYNKNHRMRTGEGI